MSNQQHRDGDALVEVVVVLVGLQAAILLTSTIEAAVFVSFLGAGAIGALVLSGLAALATLATSVGLARRAPWARRWTVVAEGAVVAVALFDALVFPIAAGTGPALVPVLTRIVVPLAVIGLLRRPSVRTVFVRPARAPSVEVPA